MQNIALSVNHFLPKPTSDTFGNLFGCVQGEKHSASAHIFVIRDCFYCRNLEKYEDPECSPSSHVLVSSQQR